jgi:hypothetical protein
MNEPVKYRQNAVECYEMARILSDHREKVKMLAMAQSWISLAALAERHRHLEAAGRSFNFSQRGTRHRRAALLSAPSKIHKTDAAAEMDRRHGYLTPPANLIER